MENRAARAKFSKRESTILIIFRIYLFYEYLQFLFCEVYSRLKSRVGGGGNNYICNFVITVQWQPLFH